MKRPLAFAISAASMALAFVATLAIPRRLSYAAELAGSCPVRSGLAGPRVLVGERG